MKAVLIICLVIAFAKYTSGDGLKFNVVLFLANTGSCDVIDGSGIDCLDFSEKTRVKHCVWDKEDDPVQTPSGCKQLLKASLMSLIGYSRNILGMTTAIASLSNDTFGNELRMKKSNDLEIEYNVPVKLMKRSNTLNPFLGDKMELKTRKKLMNKLIRDPSHTEIFKPRQRRKNQLKNKKCCQTQPKTENSIWDNLGIMASIKLTFFGKLFENDECNSEEVTDWPKSKTVHLNYLGQPVQYYSLFGIVKKTLESVLQACESGFLMIVLGGDLSQVSDAYSPLVQSVKYVTENTNEDSTLIVVTGSCSSEESTSGSCIPVFVRGPKCDEFVHTTEVFDIPYTIKNILAGISLIQDNYMNMHDGRRKRSTRTKSHLNTAAKMLPSLLFCLVLLPLM